MASEENTNKAIANSFLKLFSDMQFDQAFALLAEDMKWTTFGKLPFSGTFNKYQIRDFCSGLLDAYSTMPQWVVDDVIAEGDKIAMRAHSHGVTKNNFVYNNSYHIFMRIKDGQIYELIEYMDTQHAAELVASFQ